MNVGDANPALLLGPAPCTGCPHAQRCGEQYLACAAFSSFAQGAPERVWQRLERDPNEATYRRLML